jgi:hypothetical protein
MAVDFVEPGGEYYYSLATPLAPGAWSGAPFGGAGLVNNAPAGASTTYAISLTPGAFLYKNLSTNFATFIHGERLYISGAFTPNSIVFQFMDEATNQVEIRVDALGHLYATRNGTQVGTSSTLQLVAASGWNYIEAQVTFNSTTGAVEVWANNAVFLNLTGLNTVNSGNSYCNRIQLGNPCGATVYVKDVYMLDTSTGVNTTRLGDITVGILWPNAAGVNQSWSNNGGASQTASVQDGIAQTGTWPDGDATYISSNTPNQISDFAHQTLALTGTIFAVLHVMYTRKDDAGARQIAGVCLSSATTAVGATQNLGNTYQYFMDVIENDPNTSAPWLVAGLNSATFGVKEIS